MATKSVLRYEAFDYELVIIGGGVTGTAARFAQRYGNLGRILHIERRHAVGQVNSNVVNNSQTLHTGGIETNYGLQAALKVRSGAMLVNGYVDQFAPHISITVPKIVIGVGEEEVAKLQERYRVFSPEFPEMRLLERDELGDLEPNVMKGRDPNQPTVALFESNGKAVDYRRLSESFMRESAGGTAAIDTVFHEAVDSIGRLQDGGFAVTAGRQKVTSKAVIVAAGSPSLTFAHKMGYGLDYGMLPVAGDFWITRGALHGKVYTVQDDRIPFAAVHGDPAVYDRNETRFGPTAKPMVLLERNNYGTFREFVGTGMLTPRGAWAALRVAANWHITKFLLKNALYGVPVIGRRAFLKSVRKIVPSMEAADLRLDKGAGGIRGQLVHIPSGTLARGKDKLVEDGVIFIMAPSPGASYCLGNAFEDVRTLGGANFFGDAYYFDEAAFKRDLGIEDKRPSGKTTVEVRS